ncbi:MAG: DUF4157 domain-containing protein, partial [Nodosilinea sp.]
MDHAVAKASKAKDPVQGRKPLFQAGRSRLSTNTPLLQRQASCACGGGCPRCQHKPVVQSKLKIGAVGDRYEQEADRIADQVLRMPEPSVQRQVNPKAETEETVQKQAILRSASSVSKDSDSQSHDGSDVSFTVHEVLRSPGQPLDAVTSSFMEPRFGYSFNQVKIHTDTKAALSAKALSAKAYTAGQEIVFGAGQY